MPAEYDRLGFLLKLDSKLPADLATKYANFSEGTCKPGYASALMTAIFPSIPCVALTQNELGPAPFPSPSSVLSHSHCSGFGLEQETKAGSCSPSCATSKPAAPPDLALCTSFQQPPH
ncbi:hypothetical protein CB1_000365076 [Camelus ferus]|nr:hypothetical protein CB1_000365076 [Camelus ferus]